MAAAALPFLLPAFVGAQEMSVPIDLQVSVLRRVWSYDRAQERRLGDGFVVGVVFDRRRASSRRAREDFETALRGQVAVDTPSLPRLVSLDMAPGPALFEALVREGVDVVYVAPLPGADLAALAAVTRRAGVLSCTGVPGYVAEGLSVGVSGTGDGAGILVNLQAARAEGADFRSQLLRRVTLVGASR
jgi:hypothetical protein